MLKPRRKFSKFQLAEPDCKAQFGNVVVKVFGLMNVKPKIEYNRKDTHKDIKTAVKFWVKFQKFGGLSLNDYLYLMLNVKDYAIK